MLPYGQYSIIISFIMGLIPAIMGLIPAIMGLIPAIRGDIRCVFNCIMDVLGKVVYDGHPHHYRTICRHKNH